MRYLTYIILTTCFILNTNKIYSEEVNIPLPSEQTWNDIETKSTPSDNLGNSTNPSLRAAPPEGPSIGETSIEHPSIKGLILIGLFYFLLKFKRIYYLWDEK